MSALPEISTPDPLPTKFRSDGFNFQIVHRDGAVALLAKQKSNHTQMSYEVAIIQTHPAECLFGRDLPEREVMPPSESWGTLGWSYVDLADAVASYDQLCQARGKGHFPPGGSGASASKRLRRPSAATPRTTRPAP